MSFYLAMREDNDLAALLTSVVPAGVRIEPDPTTGHAQRLYVSTAAFGQLLPSDRRRIHDHVHALGIEAWCEDHWIVFHRAVLPLHREAHRAHAARVAFLLERVPE